MIKLYLKLLNTRILYVCNNSCDTFFLAAANPGTVAQTYDYGYGRAAPAATYDATKTYYQQPAAAAATYTTTETHYQAAKPAYSTTSAYTGTARQATTTGQAKTYQASSTAYQQSNPTQSATYSTGYTAPATPAATPSTATNSKLFVILLPLYILYPKHSGPILITNCDVGTNNMKLILSRYVKKMKKGQKFTKTLLAFSNVITTRGFSRSLKFFYLLLNYGVNFQIYHVVEVLQFVF